MQNHKLALFSALDKKKTPSNASNIWTIKLILEEAAQRNPMAWESAAKLTEAFLKSKDAAQSWLTLRAQLEDIVYNNAAESPLQVFSFYVMAALIILPILCLGFAPSAVAGLMPIIAILCFVFRKHFVKKQHNAQIQESAKTQDNALHDREIQKKPAKKKPAKAAKPVDTAALPVDQQLLRLCKELEDATLVKNVKTIAKYYTETRRALKKYPNKRKEKLIGDYTSHLLKFLHSYNEAEDLRLTHKESLEMMEKVRLYAAELVLSFERILGRIYSAQAEAVDVNIEALRADMRLRGLKD